MRDRLERDLQTIGLSDKEAKVYLAALELGDATAQTLAAKATVNRPTTYIMIESLAKRGLLSEVQKGKKRYFAAAAPDHLLELMTGQRREIQKKEDVARQLLPDLAELARASQGKTPVRIFEGEDAFTALQRDILASGAKDVRELSTASDGSPLPLCLRGALRKDVSSACRVRVLAADAALRERGAKIETRPIDAKAFPANGDVVTYGSKVFLASRGEENTGVLIDDARIAGTFAATFEALWNFAK